MARPLSETVRVVHGQGDFSSKLVSLVDREVGTLLANIEGAKPASKRAYTSVQVSEDSDIELNSDLVFTNHSCDPSVIFDMEKCEVRIVDGRSLKQGDTVTFFYPSTEWNMQQPFRCNCGSENCLGLVNGARYLDESILERYWLNPHIERLLAKRDRNESEHNGRVESEMGAKN